MPNKYEYEERAFLDEDQFLRVKESLDGYALSQNADNKTSYFFVLPEVNVSIAATEKQAVIKYKGGQLGLGNGFEEIEVPIPPSSLNDAVRMLTVLLKVEPQISRQFRINYLLPGRIEVALKYTQTWGFHVEVEKAYEYSGDLEAQKQLAAESLNALAEKLDITYIDDETMNISKRAWAEGKQFGAYTPEQLVQKYGPLFSL